MFQLTGGAGENITKMDLAVSPSVLLFLQKEKKMEGPALPQLALLAVASASLTDFQVGGRTLYPSIPWHVPM